MYLCYFLIISPWKKGGALHSNKLKSPSSNGCFVVSLVESGPVILENKIFKVCQCIFAIMLLSSLAKKVGPFIQTNMNPHHPRMLCAKFSCNWPCGSSEDFYSSAMYFHYFVIISPWKRAGPII